MEKRSLGNTGLLVSPVGMGVLTVGRTQLDLPLDAGAALIRYALSRGINFLDTAEYYETYPYIQAALKGGGYAPVIASKSLAHSYEKMGKAIEDCRAAFGRDAIDIFLLHEVRQAPDLENRAGAWQALIDAKAKGRVKAIGLSTHHADVAALCAGLPGLDVLFPLINFKSLGIREGENAGTKEAMAGAIRAAAAAGKGVFAMKVFGGGNLSGDYVEALDYVTGLPGIDSVMIGMGSEKDVDDAVDYFEGRLPEGYRPDVSQKTLRVDRGDCEGCGKCARHCPSRSITLDAENIAVIDPANCLTCGYCAYACPVRAIILI
ncbi:MAG: aldo/keto reductase [Clostridiales Family XIII bacterium]|nr:aldo/keto reductase [Clostridiales Family XIII bacterium]